MARSLGELAAMFGCELIGDPSVTVSGVATLPNAGAGQLSFFANESYGEQLRTTRAAAVIVRPDAVGNCPVASLVAGALESNGIAGGTELRALVFLTIAGTVLLAGVTAAPVGRLLGVRLPGRDTIAILGANARRLLGV